MVNGPIVGLVDTAVDPPAEFDTYMLKPLSVVGAPEAPGDQPSHGTAMLETVLGSMAANPRMVLPVDVYGSGDSTTTFDVMEGIVSAINAGANPINLSLGGTGNSQMMGSLISEAEQKGIEFVAAAGNTPGTETTYPAAYPGVLAVTASVSQRTTGALRGRWKIRAGHGAWNLDDHLERAENGSSKAPRPPRRL